MENTKPNETTVKVTLVADTTQFDAALAASEKSAQEFMKKTGGIPRNGLHIKCEYETFYDGKSLRRSSIIVDNLDCKDMSVEQLTTLATGFMCSCAIS